jgi:hypothetical protein
MIEEDAKNRVRYEQERKEKKLSLRKSIEHLETVIKNNVVIINDYTQSEYRRKMIEVQMPDLEIRLSKARNALEDMLIEEGQVQEILKQKKEKALNKIALDKRKNYEEEIKKDRKEYFTLGGLRERLDSDLQ